MAFLVYGGGLKYFHIPSQGKISLITSPGTLLMMVFMKRLKLPMVGNSLKLSLHISRALIIVKSLKLIGKDLYIDKEQLPKLADGKHYWYELVGFSVIIKIKFRC